MRSAQIRRRLDHVAADRDHLAFAKPDASPIGEHHVAVSLEMHAEPAATYASSAVANGLLFLGGNDFTFRALDLATGEILWSEEVQGAVSGGSVVSGDDVFAVAGIREPGLDERRRPVGCTRFGLATAPPRRPRRQPRPPRWATRSRPSSPRACPARPSRARWTSASTTRPRARTRWSPCSFTAEPLAIEVTATDLGAPEDWVRRGSAAARAGATRFGVFLSERDDDPFGGGGLVCSWAEGEDGCTGTAIPRFAPSYNRLSVLAVVDETTEPTLSDGADRLVRTLSFDPPLAPLRVTVRRRSVSVAVVERWSSFWGTHDRPTMGDRAAGGGAAGRGLQRGRRRWCTTRRRGPRPRRRPTVTATTTTVAPQDALPEEVIVFGAEGNRLWAYGEGDPAETQVVIPSVGGRPRGGPRHQRPDLLLPRRLGPLHRRRGHRPARPARRLGDSSS